MNEWVLRIRRLRIKDFGHYQCQAYNNQSKTLYQQDVLLTGNLEFDVSSKSPFCGIFNFLGVPFKAKFDELKGNVGTTVELSWRVNCSANAPIINYQLEFQEIPNGQWLSINVPAQLSLQSTEKELKRIVEYRQSYTLKGLNKGTKYRVRLRDK